LSFISVLILPSLLLIPILLALGPALMEKSWKRYFISLAQCLFGIMVPLVVFGLSGFMSPEYKDECRFGIWSCWHGGRWAFTPLVFFSCASFYAYYYLATFQRVKARYDLDTEEALQEQGLLMPTWILVGLFSGAVFAGISTVYGLISLLFDRPMGMEWVPNGLYPFLLVPLGVTMWYGWLWKSSPRVHLSRAYLYVSGLLIGLFLFLSYFLSKIIYSKLQDTRVPDDCFVVTAASRGHDGIVGARTSVLHKGRRIMANEQLQTFWAFEAQWKSRAPRSHRLFRFCYNRIGPPVARCVRGPLIADAVYLLLKPLERLARFF
jgi:hypothetical protein